MDPRRTLPPLFQDSEPLGTGTDRPGESRGPDRPDLIDLPDSHEWREAGSFLQRSLDSPTS